MLTAGTVLIIQIWGSTFPFRQVGHFCSAVYGDKWEMSASYLECKS